MREQNDWRLTNQEKYLQGVMLTWKSYTRSSETWEHEHCEFCWKKFMDLDAPDILRAGYTTEDECHWICETCFLDFQDMFDWKIMEAQANK